MQTERNKRYYFIWVIVFIVGISMSVYECTMPNNRVHDANQSADNVNKAAGGLIGRNYKKAYPVLTEKLMDLMQPDSYWVSNEPDVKININGKDCIFGVNTSLVIENFERFEVIKEYYDPQTQAPMAKLKYSEKWELKCDSPVKTFYFTVSYPGTININNLGMNESLYRQFELEMSDRFKKEKEKYEKTQKKGYYEQTPIKNEIVKLNSTEFEYKNALTDKIEKYKMVKLTPEGFEEYKKQIRF